MSPIKAAAFAATALLAATAASAGPFDAFKGKMKEGQYETKMTMEMPGMPQGMGKQQMTHSHCVTAQDIEGGRMGSRDKMPEKCEIKNFNMSGNTATYTTVCKGDPEMTVDSKITFVSDGYTMDMKMAMKQGGQPMNMTQKIEAKYVGACKK